MNGMDNSTQRRRGVLSLVMLGVLLAAVGAAWALQNITSRRAAAGAAIVADIRQKGLKSFWGDKTQWLWYVEYEGQQPKGWRLALRVPVMGGYHGMSMNAEGPRGNVEVKAVSLWQLSEDLSAGRYESQIHTRQGGLVTQILLGEGMVQVSVATPQESLQREKFSVPDNYLAEDTLGLAIARTAAERADAGFNLVIDEAADMRQLRLHYLGQEFRQGKALDRVSMSSMIIGQRNAETYLVDENGVVQEMTFGDKRVVLSDRATIEKLFGDPMPLVLPRMPDAMRAATVPDRHPAAGLLLRLLGK